MKTNELTNGQYFKQNGVDEQLVGRKIDLPTMKIVTYFHQIRTWTYADDNECELITFQEALLIAVQNCAKNPEPVEPIPETVVKLAQLQNRNFALENGKICRKYSLGVNNAILVYFDDEFPDNPFVNIKCSIGNILVIPVSLQQGLLHIIEQTCK